MSVLFDDLRPRRVVGINAANGNLRVKDGSEVIEMELNVGSTGALYVTAPEPAPIDQKGETDKRPVRERWAEAGIDQ